jgi:glutaredoxin-like protein
MPNSNIIIYGTTWCWDCRRARRFLDKNRVAYEWIDIDKDQEAEAYVKNVNQGNRSVPTIIFADESILVEPSNDQLAEKLRGLNG